MNRLFALLFASCAFCAHAQDGAAALARVEQLSEQRRLGEAEALLKTLRGAADIAAIDLESARIALRRGQFVLAEQRMLSWFDRHVERGGRLRQRATIVLAQARFEQRDFDVAESMLRELDTSSPPVAAERAYALAAVLLARGNWNDARAELQHALPPLRDSHPLLRAQLLCYLTFAEILHGDIDVAEHAITAALALRREHSPGSVGEAVARYFSSYVERARGRPDAADQALLSAIDILEKERQRQSADSDTRDQWAAQFAFFYREAIMRAVDRGDLAEALALAQRMRGATTAVAHLDDATLLLSFVVHHQRTVVLTQYRGALAAVDLAPIDADLRDTVDAVLVLIAAREHADHDALHARLAKLYLQLLAPAWRDGVRRILVQPDGPLHALPFAALITNLNPRRFLIEDVVIERADTLGELAPIASEPPWIVGDSGAGSSGWLRAVGGRLDAAVWEARAISELYTDATLLLGPDASEAGLRALPRSADVHIAAHMLRDPFDEQRSFIALGASGGEDGRLYDAEISRYAGRRSLVVLSGCASQRGALASTGPLSMARAWHRAGAQRVLSTLWPVPDDATARTMLSFHRARLAHGDVAQALADAQRSWLAEYRKPAVATRLRTWWQRSEPDAMTLPFYWAAAVVSR